MYITQHAIKRYQERVTSANIDVIYSFIERDILNSTLLYSLNGIEKRESKGIVYVIDPRERSTVITLYLNC